jgi:hypothetical protein
MISSRIYAQKYDIREMLNVFIHTDVGNEYIRSSVARVIYWDYSFNFGNSNEFCQMANKFIEAGGIRIMLNIACNDMCFSAKDKFQYLSYPEYYRDQEYHMTQFSPSFPNRVFNLFDIVFRLPTYALCYHRAILVGANINEGVIDVTCTQRQLAIEILSEMSNYHVYRREIGTIFKSLKLMISTLKALCKEFLIYETQNKNVDNNRTIFLIDRLINLFANLALDAESTMSDSRDFVIYDGANLFEKSEVKWSHWKEATRTLPCYMLDQLSNTLITIGDQLHCTRTLRNISRFFCNTFSYMNPLITMKLLSDDLSHSFCKWIKLYDENLAALMNRETDGMDAMEDLEQDDMMGEPILDRLVSGLRMAEKALILYRNKLTILKNLHHISYDKWIALSLDQ